MTIVLVRRRRRKPEEIDRGPEKSHKKERGGKRERERELITGRSFSAFARLFTTASGGNQPSSREGLEEGMKCPKCRHQLLHDNDGGGSGSKDEDGKRTIFFPAKQKIGRTCMLQRGDGSAEREMTAKKSVTASFLPAILDLQLALARRRGIASSAPELAHT